MSVSISRRAWSRQFAFPSKADRRFARRRLHLRLPAPVVFIVGGLVAGAAIASTIPRIIGRESGLEQYAAIVAVSFQRDKSNFVRPTPELWKSLLVPNRQVSQVASNRRPLEWEQ